MRKLLIFLIACSFLVFPNIAYGAGEDVGGVKKSGTIDTSGTPVANDFAKFTDADTIEGRSYAEVKEDLDLEVGTDVEAKVTEGSLADSVIVSADIKDDTIAAADLAHVISSVNQVVSVDDAGTLTPTAGYARIFIALTALTDPSAMTLSETGAVDNVVIYIVNVAANTATFADTAGVQELKAPATVEQYESIAFRYEVDRWVEIGRATNALGFSSITTTETEYIPITAFHNTAANNPAAKETITSTYSAVVRNFDGAANETLELTWKVPGDIVVASGIKFQFTGWVTNGTQPANGEIVAFSLAGASRGNSDILSGAVGTAQTSSLTADATYVQYDSLDGAYSSAITITDLAKGEKITFLLTRLATTTDTYAQDYGPEGVNLKYVRDHTTTF